MHAFKKRVLDHLLRLEPYPAPIETCLESSLSMCIYVRVSDPKAISQRLFPKSRQRPDSGSQLTRGSGVRPALAPHLELLRNGTSRRLVPGAQVQSSASPSPSRSLPSAHQSLRALTQNSGTSTCRARAARSARRFPGSPPGRPQPRRGTSGRDRRRHSVEQVGTARVGPGGSPAGLSGQEGLGHEHRHGHDWE